MRWALLVVETLTGAPVHQTHTHMQTFGTSGFVLVTPAGGGKRIVRAGVYGCSGTPAIDPGLTSALQKGIERVAGATTGLTSIAAGHHTLYDSPYRRLVEEGIAVSTSSAGASGSASTHLSVSGDASAESSSLSALELLSLLPVEARRMVRGLPVVGCASGDRWRSHSRWAWPGHRFVAGGPSCTTRGSSRQAPRRDSSDVLGPLEHRAASRARGPSLALV